MSCDQTLYIKLMSHLMEELSKSQTAAGSTQNTRTYIQVEKMLNHVNKFPVRVITLL